MPNHFLNKKKIKENVMQKILILRGIPASGKSTFAKQYLIDHPEFRRINRDALREMHNGYIQNEDNEKFIKKLRDLIIMETLLAGNSVIVDDTNISPKNENRITDISREYTNKTGKKVEIETMLFDITLDEAIKRDSERERPVGHKQITKMHNTLNGIREDRGPNYKPQDTTLPSCIICDLDGTLAILNGRSPFNASECEKDLLNEPIAHILATYMKLGDKIILLSGRMDEHKDQTIAWLEKYKIDYDQLIMRKTGDMRKDAIVKKEIVDENIWGKYFIRFTLDDRNQVVDMWRHEVGVACLQVNYGNF
jgi:predicted kinase